MYKVLNSTYSVVVAPKGEAACHLLPAVYGIGRQEGAC